ncbi:MAG: hypothetical protein WCL32_04540 [Planctomycetota bacterium]
MRRFMLSTLLGLGVVGLTAGVPHEAQASWLSEILGNSQIQVNIGSQYPSYPPPPVYAPAPVYPVYAPAAVYPVYARPTYPAPYIPARVIPTPVYRPAPIVPQNVYRGPYHNDHSRYDNDHGRNDHPNQNWRR